MPKGDGFTRKLVQEMSARLVADGDLARLNVGRYTSVSGHSTQASLVTLRERLVEPEVNGCTRLGL